MLGKKTNNTLSKVEKVKYKKRSKIIVDILNGNISVSDALYKLKVLLSDLDNETVNDWIEAELTGYNTNEVPFYRKFKGQVFGNVQVGYYIYNNINIPIKDEFRDLIKSSITDNITTVESYSKEQKDENMGIPVDLGLINQIASLEMDGFTQIIRANIIIAPSIFSGIVNSVKKTLLDILMDLEKKYGILDDYYIEFSNKSDKEKTANTIINIIKIGDNNKIKSSVIGGKDEN